MIRLSNGGILLQAASELPNPCDLKNLYMDFETTSFDSNVAAFNPWKGHRILGASFSFDDDEEVFYAPLRHQIGNNLELEKFLEWMRSIFSFCPLWINHNVKFDAHFLKAEGIDFTGGLRCTLQKAKVLYNNRWGESPYGLDSLSKDWLQEDISSYESDLKKYLQKTKDYAIVPIDIMASYACQDVVTTRKLEKFINEKKDESSDLVFQQEELLTPVLFDMEQQGFRVDPDALKLKELYLSFEILTLEKEIHRLTERTINPGSNDDCYDLICNQYGLPVLGWTKDRFEPSFDKAALLAYKELDGLSEDILVVIDKIMKYRKASTLLTFYVIPYQELQVDGHIHSSFNQNIRTGRMSSKNPNSQGLSEEAKELVLPEEGESFVGSDYSQIEFRIMVDYMDDQRCIKAYNEDPDTDFHVWVATMCGIPRRPAKNVNFAIGYGAGEKKILAMLSAEKSLTENLRERLEELHGEQWLHFLPAAKTTRAREVFNQYHEALPNLRPTSKAAERSVRSRRVGHKQGYSVNRYGRRAYFDTGKEYKAFNAATQGTAADFVKEKMIALAPRYNEDVRNSAIKIVVNVHDEILTSGPTEVMEDRRTISYLHYVLELQEKVKFQVPIQVKSGISAKNWALATNKVNPIEPL